MTQKTSACSAAAPIHTIYMLHSRLSTFAAACVALLECASLGALFRSCEQDARSNPYVHPMGG